MAENRSLYEDYCCLNEDTNVVLIDDILNQLVVFFMFMNLKMILKLSTQYN